MGKKKVLARIADGRWGGTEGEKTIKGGRSV